MTAGIQAAITELQKSSLKAKARIKNAINNTDPAWATVFTNENRENAFAVTLALFDGKEKVAKKMTSFYINKYTKAAPAAKQTTKRKMAQHLSSNRIIERWMNPEFDIKERTQLFASPCNTCPLQTVCTRSKTLLLECECKVIKGHKVSVLQSFMFVDSKLPKKLMEDIKKQVVMKGETERWTDKWQYNN